MGGSTVAARLQQDPLPLCPEMGGCVPGSWRGVPWLIEIASNQESAGCILPYRRSAPSAVFSTAPSPAVRKENFSCYGHSVLTLAEPFPPLGRPRRTPSEALFLFSANAASSRRAHTPWHWEKECCWGVVRRGKTGGKRAKGRQGCLFRRTARLPAKSESEGCHGVNALPEQLNRFMIDKVSGHHERHHVGGRGGEKEEEKAEQTANRGGDE